MKMWKVLSLSICLVLLLPLTAMANLNTNMGISLNDNFVKSGANYFGVSPDNYLNESWFTSNDNFTLHIGSWGQTSGYVVLLVAIPKAPSSADFTSLTLTHDGSSTTINSTDAIWWGPATELIDSGNSSDEIVNGHGIWYDNFYMAYAVGWMAVTPGANLDHPGTLEEVGVSVVGAAADFKMHFDVFNTSYLDSEANGFVNGYGSVLGVNASSTDTSYFGDGGDVVPEPTTLLLMLPGLVTLLHRRRG